ncbi:unnamed protein product [Phytomonas sp. EM1]|nr:unnamed protein product [Phytomonas sp. EM1]|eukprot:CCW61858.1 unnamed protein product [Phytomonas sp. isolate EM1]
MFTHKSKPSGTPFAEEPQTKATTMPPLNTSSAPFESNPAAGGGAGSRKRGRDIYSLERFKQVVFGERGFPQLHAMVARNPILMYPPLNVDAVRQRYSEAKGIAAEETNEKSAKDPDEAEAGAPKDGDPESDEVIRNYHHKQLDAFLHLLYEFNHMTFVKLPMNDTLQLLSRCGREAVAHITEFEMHQRMKHHTRLRELRTSHEERHRLRSQLMELEEVQAQAELDRVEAAQRELELMEVDPLNEGDGKPEECAPSYSLNVLEEMKGGERNSSFLDDTHVGTQPEVDAMNGPLPALEENVSDGPAEYDSRGLTAKHEPHPLSEPSLQRSGDDGNPYTDHL